MLKDVESHDGRPFDLVKAVRSKPVTVLVVFRGPWCPYCVTYWNDLADRAAELEGLGAQVLGLSADKPKALRRFRKDETLPFVMLSDPRLQAKKDLGVKSEKDHPMAETYKKGAFLQPGVFVWTQDGKLQWAWWQDSPDLDNAFGAGDRPHPDAIVEAVRKALGVEAPAASVG